ncbi:lipid-A-disaccharide synthase [Chitinibacter tainanensis]|uniref:lipid-A-disaccharide synthase n=1 Tax=Chitinibacter tainanensis TaxID=230667 RepID=UPI00235371B1|nr:lipid-A-disaccharide synthase [Chitinibacter tainanensis]
MSEFQFSPGAWPKIAIVAGEASGDTLGASLIDEIKLLYPNAEFWGVAGPKMQSYGARTIEPLETLSVGGIVEVLKHLPELLRLRKRLVKSCLHARPDLFIGIDAPDFNIGLARRLKARGIKTMHYVSPSIWAWRPERIKKIKAAIDHILLLLPFEKEIYDQAGVASTYVGHPLADQMAVQINVPNVREVLNLPAVGEVVAILPGSRQREVAALAELFIDTALVLAERFPKITFLVPFVSRETRLIFEQTMWRKGAQELNWRLMFGHSHEAMVAADAVLLASGTAALEAMLAKKPTVVAYRLSNLTYKLVKRKYLLPYVSLPNIITKRFVIPEFLQDEATVENLAQSMSNYLLDKSLRQQVEQAFTDLHVGMRCNAGAKAAAAVYKMLGNR